MSAWCVNLGGLGLVGLIVWWFWLSAPRPRRVDQARRVDILVEDGVYTPASIACTAGAAVTLCFLRRDPSPTAGQVVFEGLDITAELPLDAPREVTLRPSRPGRYRFTCQTGLYQGLLVVS